MSMNVHLLLGFFAAMSVRPCEQCSPVEPLTDVLERAEKSAVGGRITLSMDKPRPAKIEIPVPACPGQSSLATMYRVPAGQVAVFDCTIPECAHRESCPEADEIIWGHLNYSVRRVLSHYYSSPFAYSVSKNATFSRLFIHNITADAAGPVHCLWTNDQDESCIRAFYDLKPFLSAADIFVTTAQNVSGPTGKTVTLRCDLQAPLYGTLALSQRYIWRYEGHVLMAPSGHPMVNLMRSTFPVHFAYNGTYTSASITDPPESCSGHYQCWVRPFEELDEWFVQDIFLRLS